MHQTSVILHTANVTVCRGLPRRGLGENKVSYGDDIGGCKGSASIIGDVPLCLLWPLANSLLNEKWWEDR